MAITSGDLSFMPTVTALMFCQASLGFIYSIFAAWEHKTTNRTTLATLTIILIALTHMTLSATFATNLMTDYVSYFDETRSIWVTIEGYSAGASFVLIVALIVVILIRFIGKHFRWNTHTASFVSHFGQTRNSSSEPQWPGTAPFATRN